VLLHELWLAFVIDFATASPEPGGQGPLEGRDQQPEVVWPLVVYTHGGRGGGPGAVWWSVVGVPFGGRKGGRGGGGLK
jgi:hypothetical protein